MNNELITEDSLLAMRWEDQVMYLATHGAEDKIIRALIRTKSETKWQQLKSANTPQVVNRAIETLYWEHNEFAKSSVVPEVTKYRPIKKVIDDYLGYGNRRAARKELQVRLPYLSYSEQIEVIHAFFCMDYKKDRVFIFNYINDHFDPIHIPTVEAYWEIYHELETARILTNYASDEFIAENFEQLVKDYRYLPVRLRMPADYPVDRAQLEWHELINLCARQHLSITEEEAFAILSNVIHLQLIRENVAFEGNSLLRLAYVSAVLWALGELGFQDLVLRFYVENERTKPLFRSGDKDAIAWEIREQIYHDGFCTSRKLGTKEDVEARDLAKKYMEQPEDFEDEDE